MIRKGAKTVVLLALLILTGCVPAISEDEIDATVNARVAGTLSAIMADDQVDKVLEPDNDSQPTPLPPAPDNDSKSDTPVGDGPSIGGCPVFPVDHVWNTPVDHLPAHGNSDAYISSIGADASLHPDFGSGLWEGDPIGIPYNVVDGSTIEPADINFYYPDESDPGPYPIPDNPLIEGGGDRHILIVDTSTCHLIEIYDASTRGIGGRRWEAGSGAIWDLNDYLLRPDTWTSADAAGLPILPGLVRYEEVTAGEIRHALRFTAEETRQAYEWPARHFASDITSANVPPMGQRFRLKTDFDITPYPAEVQVILRAMQIYGIILADNGADWFISGAPDPNWDNDMLVEAFHSIDGSNFEAVDTTSLMIDSDSGKANQP